MKYDELIKNRNSNIKPKGFLYNEKYVETKDEIYLEFLKRYNGGYFYNNALILFGFSKEENQLNISHMNTLFKNYYQNLIDGLYFFGQDIFGNAFGFRNEKIVFFNIESGQKEILAENFEKWLDILYNDLDYYTGKSLACELNDKTREELTKEKRLCPKYPFILGGEYSLDNLALMGYIDNINYNSNIAKQVYNLPEGSKIKIIINNL